jgi:hypothetical protein
MSGVFVNVSSDTRKSWRWNVHADGNQRAYGGWTFNTNTALSVQPSDRLQASVAAGYGSGFDVAQWIGNQDADGDGAVDHVYGALTRDVVDVTLRGTWAFSRDLTLQAFLQPFVAVGDYDDIRKLAAPRSFQFTPVQLAANPDFSNKSLRGNLVMRWEYKPGSTIFAVWDMSMADPSRPGQFSAFRDLRSSFGAPANHVLMIKASYWINL